jgi:O-acetyl-ADP-ribose deacetylase (regulator of RNase III)
MGNYKHIVGNLLDAKTDVIGHQTNCFGVMGGGVAKQIKTKWLNVFKPYYDLCVSNRETILGTCQVIAINDHQYIANLFGQYGHDASVRQTNYEAIYTALEGLFIWMHSNKKSSVAFPYKLSSGLAGAEWSIIESMIKFIFKDFDVEIWEYK